MTSHSPHSSPNHPKKAPLPVFFAAVVMLFFCTMSAADSIGFVPDYIDGTSPATADVSHSTDSSVALSNLPDLGVTNSTPTATAPVASGIEPVRIIIPAGNIDLPVQNPTTTDVDALDALLKHGPAHFINSANLGETGNLIIFAHSSHLPVVINKMFQAFNNIPKLKAGDSITIVGDDGKNYLYSVVSVVKASVNDGTTIDTSALHGTNLTLVTCDTLTGVSARFVLSATYIGVSDSNTVQ